MCRMRNLSDHDIDNLFLQAAEDHQPPFHADDWEAMSKKLDEADRAPRYLKWIAVLLIIGTVSVFTWVVSVNWKQEENANSVNQVNRKRRHLSELSNVPLLSDSNTVHTSDAKINNVPTNATDRVATQRRVQNKHANHTAKDGGLSNVPNKATVIPLVITHYKPNPTQIDRSLTPPENNDLGNLRLKEAHVDKITTDTVAQVSVNDSTKIRKAIDEVADDDDQQKQTFHRLAV